MATAEDAVAAVLPSEDDAATLELLRQSLRGVVGGVEEGKSVSATHA